MRLSSCVPPFQSCLRRPLPGGMPPVGKGGGEVNWMLCRALAMVVGFAGEQLVGWPRRLYHPIMAIGALISKAEKLLRAVFSKSRAGERAAGIAHGPDLAACFPGAAAGALLYVLYRWSWIAGFLVESAMCWSIFASGQPPGRCRGGRHSAVGEPGCWTKGRRHDCGPGHGAPHGGRGHQGHGGDRGGKYSPTASLRLWYLPP